MDALPIKKLIAHDPKAKQTIGYTDLGIGDCADDDLAKEALLCWWR